MIRLPRLSREALSSHIENCKILERDLSVKNGFDLKVVVTSEGVVYKFFRVRHFFSSNLISPYARRFARNARRLNRSGVQAPEVRDIFYVPALKRQVAVYHWIEGETLVDYLRRQESDQARAETFCELGRFIAVLHHKGIHFHAGHLNNYVRTQRGGFALIDVTDVRFLRGPLDRKTCLKNLRKLARKPVDYELLEHDGWEALLEGYHAQANVPGVEPVTIWIEELKATASR